jgi:hypothetical protein
LRSGEDFAVFDRDGREAGCAAFFCAFTGVDLRAVFLAGVAVLDVRVAALGAVALFALFFAVLPLEDAIPFDFVALRAGAFSAAERLWIDAGRAVDLPATVRLFPEDVEEGRETGREEDLLMPLTIGSLMRSHQLSKGALNHRATA